MWDAENRRRYDRSKLRYPSDPTDDDWAIITPLIPPAKRGGNKRTVNVRGIVNGLMYILRGHFGIRAERLLAGVGWSGQM
jgi:hypothetical protein